MFRLRPGTKLPFHGTRGFYDATVNEERIDEWWRQSPHANVALRTGRASGILVVDEDRLGAYEELEREIGPQPETWTVGTPRGGMHRYFRLPEGEGAPCSAGDGLDVRADGGYVVVPPSLTPEGSYRVLNRAPMAQAPAELVEWARSRRSSPALSRRHEKPRPRVEGGPILEGVRNSVLFFEALRLKDSGKSRDEVLDELLATNEARCAPPLDASEVERIVKSATRYPIRSGRPSPEVLEAVERLEEFWWAHQWSGMGGRTDRDIFRVLIELARRYGRLREDGSLAVAASVRSVALAAATRYETVSGRATKRLAQAGLIRKSGSGRTSAEHAATWVLPPQASLPVNTEHAFRIEKVPCVYDPLRPRLWDLRSPAFRWTGHVKKGRAGVLYILEALGPRRLKELAELMGWGNHRELRRRYVVPLVGMGLVEDRDGLLALPEDHAERVEEIRRAPYTTVSRRRRKSVDPATGREVRWVEETESTASEVEREKEDRRDHKEHQKGWRLHLARQSPEADEQCRELLSAWDEERADVDGETRDITHLRELARVEDLEPIPAQREVFEFARDLQEIEAAVLEEPSYALADALANFLDCNPHRRGEYPSWLATALWAEDFVEAKPTPEEVGDALALLEMPA